MKALLFLAALCAPMISCKQDDVLIKVQNNSGKDITALQVAHETDTFLSTLQRGAGAEFRYQAPGENAVIITALLKDGQTVRSAQMYTEPGYRLTANIENDTIEVTTSVY